MIRTTAIATSVVAGLLTGAGCGPSQEEYDAQVALVADLRGQLEEANRRNEQAQEEIQSLRAENAAMTDRLAALGEDVSSLRARSSQLASDLEQLRQRERQQQERLATFRRMLEQFRALMDSGRLRVRIVRGRMVLEMSSNILFEPGRADLSEQGEETLAEVAEVLRTIRNRHFQVAGHTDDRPINTQRFPSNWELSTQRAVNVVHFLQEQGVSPSVLSAAGYGEYAPAAPNDTEEGRAQNRRIEIVLEPNLDELPDLSSLESESR